MLDSKPLANLLTSYHSQSKQFFDRAAIKLDRDRHAYDRFIRGLISDGTWFKFDFLYIFAAPDSTTALQNLISSSFTCLLVNTPAFTAYQGYFPTVSGTDYLNPQFNCNTAGQKFAQDSAHMGIWSRTDASGTDMGAVLNNSTNGDQRIADDGSGKSGYRINTSSGLGSDGPVYYPGHVAWSRTGSAAWSAYGNGVSLETGTDASKPFASDPMSILRSPVFGGGNNQLAAAHIGSQFSDLEMASVFLRLRTLLRSFSAA